ALPRAKSLPSSSIVAPTRFHRGGDTLICFSHLRWDFVFQRPQHLMTRFARSKTVIFFEEPIWDAPGAQARIELSEDGSGVVRAVPRIEGGLSEVEVEATLERLLAKLVADRAIERPVVWYYTPMLLGFSKGLADQAAAVVYDC